MEKGCMSFSQIIPADDEQTVMSRSSPVGPLSGCLMSNYSSA